MKKNGSDMNKNSLVERVMCPSFLTVSTLTEERATKRLDGAKHATGCPKTGMSKRCVELVVSLGSNYTQNLGVSSCFVSFCDAFHHSHPFATL